MKKDLFYILSFCLMVWSCAENADKALQPMKSVDVCRLDENLCLLNAPKSLGVIDGDSFVIAAGDNVFVYGRDGQQKSFFNRKGRGQYEYQILAYVRGCEDKLFVWDSGSNKFIAYDRDGNGIKEYPYKSAIKDFLPFGDKLYIYSAGKRSDYTVDVLDLDSGIVVDSLLNTTAEHRLLLSNESAAPLCIYDKQLFFMPRDAMDIYKYSIEGGELEKVRSVESGTFRVESVPDNSIIASDFMKAARYLFSNSYTVAIGVGKRNYAVLTNEGKAALDNRMQVTDNELTTNYYSLDGRVKEYSSERSFDTRLVSSYAGDIYFIDHSVVEEDDCYMLKVLGN